VGTEESSGFEVDSESVGEPDVSAAPADGASTGVDGESGDAGESAGEDDEESSVELAPASGGSASAMPGLFATATPTPRATANAPTRPMYLALPIPMPLPDPPQDGRQALPPVRSQSVAEVVEFGLSSALLVFAEDGAALLKKVHLPR
jgi:hypothetical protein